MGVCNCSILCCTLLYVHSSIAIILMGKRELDALLNLSNCAPLVADLFLFCYERDFMMSLSDDKLADFIDEINTTSR